MSKPTDSAVFEMRLLPTHSQAKKLLVLSELGRILYNACLGEALRRMDKVKNDPSYNKKNFKALAKHYSFNDYSLQAFAIKCKNESKFLDQLGTHSVQKIATRAYRAVHKKSLGQAKRVNFVRQGTTVSLEGKTNNTFLMYKEDLNLAIIAKMKIKVKERKNDNYKAYVMQHRIKFCRVIVRYFNGKPKFFLQVVYEGQPPQKVVLGSEKTGIDIGPSTIAIVNTQTSELKTFCSDIPKMNKKKIKLQRNAARKLRLANPQNYIKNGSVIKGSKTWKKSANYKKLEIRIADMERRLALRRKQSHGVLINEILRQSNEVHAEKLEYKKFQKDFGRSIGACAPSMFNERLKNKIIQLGGNFIEINTYTTKLSQTCLCGNVKKKDLSQRRQICSCGINHQRDIFSAFLAIFVKDGQTLDLASANQEYKNYTLA
ncbi:MAG: transposase [Erysipelotrichaceae bacterium]